MKQLKKTGLLFFLLINCLLVTAQKHFIYVQSENQQPFAIVMNGKVFSSSDYGYIIIPKLDDGDYKFTVSFPLNKFPDQSFAVSVKKKDVGYFLKNNNNSWALENMQTQQAITNGDVTAASKSTAFGEMLSDVVSDSTLTKTPATPAATDKEGGVGSGLAAGAEKEGGTGIGNGLAEAAAVTTGAVITAVAPQKLGETKTGNGTNMIFLDQSGNSADTVFVFIPADKKKPDEIAAENTISANVTQDSLATASFQSTNAANLNEADAAETKNKANEETVTEKSATDVSNPFYKPEEAKTAATVTTGAAATDAVVNNNTTANDSKGNCDNPISDDELNKIKRKMFSQDNDEDMVKYAIKSVNKKCISTEQVRVLGSLFSSDDGRYNLYDAMYKHVYDYNNYPALASQILDPYYKKRFDALLR